MRLLITAGPTREPIDSVRYLSNRSSGRLGFALADAAVAAGHRVTLLAGPVSQTAPANNRSLIVRRFVTGGDLGRLLAREFSRHDVLIMAAAVCDYRPARPVRGKLTGTKGELTLRLVATPDLVARAAARKKAGQRVIAFALEEPAQLEPRAMMKLRRKGVDAIVANPLTTMDADRIKAVFLKADGTRLASPSMSKKAFGGWLIRQVEQMLAE